MITDESLKVLEPTFEGNRTLILMNDSEVYVGMRSVVEGMGLSWYSQKKKIKRYPQTPRFNYRCKNRWYNSLLLDRERVFVYLDTIEIGRIPFKKRLAVRKYKTCFPEFISEFSSKSDLTIFDSYIESGLEGIQRLVRDVAKMNYTLGYERIADILHELMTNQELTLSELTLSNKIHDIADHLAKNQTRLRK